MNQNETVEREYREISIEEALKKIREEGTLEGVYLNSLSWDGEGIEHSRPIEIKNSRFGELKINSTSSDNEIQIKDCTFDKRLIIGESDEKNQEEKPGLHRSELAPR